MISNLQIINFMHCVFGNFFLVLAGLYFLRADIVSILFYGI